MTGTISDKEWGTRYIMNGTNLNNSNRTDVEDFKISYNLGRIFHNWIKDTGATNGLTRGINISTSNKLTIDLTIKDSMFHINKIMKYNSNK